MSATVAAPASAGPVRRVRPADYVAALAPMFWGTTYIVTTELLPPGRPLLAATVRALPAGLLLTAVGRRLPRGEWWWKAALLGALNIGLFFPLLFFAAYRLPGGIAATLGAIQPLVVVVLSWPALGERPTARRIVAGVAGVAGVALLVLEGEAALDAAGVAAAFLGATSMAAGTVLTKKWGRPVSLVGFTGWQLLGGGLVLVPLTAVAEGAPSTLTGENVWGFVYLGLLGTALAYALWFRGISVLPAPAVSFLALLSPVVAAVVGYVVLGEALTPVQLLGAAVVLGSVVAGQLPARDRDAARAGAPRPSRARGATPGEAG